MVQGPITGREAPYPNAPVQDDELQQVNKFVYKWETNRWKNIHRPLIIPDYIWPDLSPGGNLLDPDGGGGDDWTRDSFSLGVTGGRAANVTPSWSFSVHPVPISDRYEGPLPNAFRAMHVAPVAGTGETPLSSNNWGKLVVTGDNFDPYGIVARPEGANAWYTGMQQGQLEFGPRIFAAMAFPTDALIGDRSILDQCKFNVRYRVTHNPRRGSAMVAGFYSDIFIEGRTSDGTNLPNLGSGGSAVSPGSYSTTYQEFEWIPINHPDKAICEYVYIWMQWNSGFEFTEFEFDLFSPFGPASTTVTPVAHGTGKNFGGSVVAFEDSQGGPSFLQGVRHGNPYSLTNSVLQDVVDCDTMLDVDTGLPLTGVRPRALFLHEFGEYMVMGRQDNMTVEIRHLRDPYDITDHSAIINDGITYYNFTTESSKTGTITGTTMKDVCMDVTGGYMYLLVDNELRRYTLSTPWDASTINVGVFDTLDLSSFAPTGFDLSADGNVLIVCKQNTMKQYFLDTAWDINNVTDTGFTRAFDLNDPIGVVVSDDSRAIMVANTDIDPAEPHGLVLYTRSA